MVPRIVVPLCVIGLFAPGSGPGMLLAQTAQTGEPTVYATAAEANRSEFRLFGSTDLAYSGLRLAGDFSGCTDNSGNLSTSNQCWNFLHPSPLFMPDWFDMFFYWAAPPSEWRKHQAAVPSLANAAGKGYTLNSPLTQYAGEMLPHDGSVGAFHSGVTDQGDGSCLDSRTIGTGKTLLAASDCPETWGTFGWQGSRPVDEEGFLTYADLVGDPGFSFDPPLVPSDLHDGNRYLGDFQTYGFFSDYTSEALFGSDDYESYGNVIPPGMGGSPFEPPERTGWPLGLLAKLDAFSFDQFGLENTAFFQITVSNKSSHVYGVPLDYDSVYLGVLPGWLQYNGGQALYRDPANGVVRGATVCTSQLCASDPADFGDPMHPIDQWGNLPPNGVGAGFHYGAAALVVLKSPIGDLRNKKFSNPTSPFFGKGDPQVRDDTITFNHGHMCGFHGCSAVTFNAAGGRPPYPSTDYEQRQFGMVASIASDVLGDRALGDASDHTMWDTFRWEEYPDRNQLDFNKWAPGGWDYNDDGVADTLYFDDCSYNAGPQSDPVTGHSKPCSVTWSDTLPGGFGNLYANRGAVTGAGPFRLPADSAVQWVMAIVMASDSSEIEDGIARAIDQYMSFYRMFEPAPVPSFGSVEVAPLGNAKEEASAPDARVTLYYDGAAEEWEDPILRDLAERLRSADPHSRLGKLRLLNPVLADTVEKLVGNNVAALHVFRSCDGGRTYTTDADCSDDPATGGKFSEVGWYPWRTLSPNRRGDFANSLTDSAAFAGRSYLYAIVSETRGLDLPVIIGEPDSAAVLAGGDTVFVCVRDCRSQLLHIAPKLIAPLPADEQVPNVVSVYVPVSNQSGYAGSKIELVSASPDLVPFEWMNVRPTQDDLVDDTYTLFFADTVIVTERARIERGEADVFRTIVQAIAGTADTVTLEAEGPVGYEADYTESIDTAGGAIERIRVSRFEYLSALLADGSGRPVMVTSSLSGGQTVPGRYFGLPNYPGFTMSIDNTGARGFEGQFYLEGGDTLSEAQEPSVTVIRHTVESARGGRYRVTWTDEAFGAASPFELDLNDPDAVVAQVLASLGSRSLGQLTSADSAVADAVGRDVADLLEVRLPFTIENVTDPANPNPVIVAIEKWNKRTSLALGNGSDVLWVEVPESEWIPGDRLVLLEGVAPDYEVAVRYLDFGCDPDKWERSGCNPVTPTSPGATGYRPVQAGQQLHFSYKLPITSQTRFEFTAESALAGAPLLSDIDRIRAALDSVKVVPNPFVLRSRYSTGNANYILFTHMPPQGVLRIFTVTGQFVQQISWSPENLNAQGDLRFDLVTREGYEMAAGLFLYVLDAMDEQGVTIGRVKGKFVIIR